MIRHKTARPATAETVNGPRKSDQPGSEISPTNTPSPAKLQAPDDRGESDHDYFTARPHARHRIRAAFPGEFPRKLLKQGRGGRQAVVIVAIERDAAGRPIRRARSLVFPDGGRA
jgi:hypothetical protein